jgi:hypothetical protein
MTDRIHKDLTLLDISAGTVAPRTDADECCQALFIMDTALYDLQEIKHEGSPVDIQFLEDAA